tara:strand:+ start:96 stop:485 length:390 start_codon:yes stop_codon:yes gene_type:complete
MPFALVPDGFELKKVTKLQKQAVDRYYRHENVKALIENTATLPIIATSVATLLAGVAIDKFIDELPSLPAQETVVKEAKETATKTALATSFIPQKLLLEGVTSGLKFAGIDSKEVDKAEQTVRDIIPFL